MSVVGYPLTDDPRMLMTANPLLQPTPAVRSAPMSFVR